MDGILETDSRLQIPILYSACKNSLILLTPIFFKSKQSMPMQRTLPANEVSELTLCRSSSLSPIPIGYLTVIPRVHIGFEMVDSQRGA